MNAVIPYHHPDFVLIVQQQPSALLSSLAVTPQGAQCFPLGGPKFPVSITSQVSNIHNKELPKKAFATFPDVSLVISPAPM